MDVFVEWLLGLVQSIDPVLRTLFAGIGIMLETSIFVGLLVPGDSIVLVASTAIENPRQWFAMMVAVLAGSLAGESIGFLLGRFFGPRIIASRVGRRVGEENWERSRHYISTRGGPAVFFSRFLPVLHSIVPFAVGMSGMRYRRFLAWTVPACVIWAVAYTAVGWLAAGSFRELSGQLHGAGYVFVGAIAVFLLIVWGVKRLILKREARYFADGAAVEVGDLGASSASDSDASESGASDVDASDADASGPGGPSPEG
ncbi:DedA family protein [Leucobacter sp. GX24907]